MDKEKYCKKGGAVEVQIEDWSEVGMHWRRVLIGSRLAENSTPLLEEEQIEDDGE